MLAYNLDGIVTSSACHRDRVKQSVLLKMSNEDSKQNFDTLFKEADPNLLAIQQSHNAG